MELRDLTIGTAINRGSKPRLLYIPSNRRYRSCYILGNPGKGKSALLQNMILQDVKYPYFIAVFDAHDLPDILLKTLPFDLLKGPCWRWFSLADPIPYNPLRIKPRPTQSFEEAVDSRVNEFIGMVDQIVLQSSSSMAFTNRMQRLLEKAIRRVAARDKDVTIITLADYLKSIEGIEELRAQMGMPRNVRSDPFPATYDGVIDRLSKLTRDVRVRRMICNPPVLDFDEYLDNGIVFLCSLGGGDTEVVQTIGTILYQGLMTAIMHRTEAQRVPAAVYIDEFPDYIKSNHATKDFQVLFTEGRKYKLGLTIAHQEFASIDSDLLHTIHQTVAAGTTICFGCGATDAKRMSLTFVEEFSPSELTIQKDYEAACRIDTEIDKFKTHEPPQAIRKVTYEEHLSRNPDPPDPFESLAQLVQNKKPQTKTPPMPGQY